MTKINGEGKFTFAERRRRLVNRQMPHRDLPKLWKAMQEEGCWFEHTRTGHQFRCGRYKITAKSISEAWSVSPSAVTRLVNWLSEQDEILWE